MPNFPSKKLFKKINCNKQDPITIRNISDEVTFKSFYLKYFIVPFIKMRIAHNQYFLFVEFFLIALALITYGCILIGAWVNNVMIRFELIHFFDLFVKINF
ncbi:hypothetical protein DMUE_5595 [Dictyocoela muelleri]|nr:hypothetical protein DMUE_5595 [Dictyocoela muelleri]